MKKIIYVLFVLVAIACNTKNNTDFKKLYQNSMKIKDYNTAIFSLQVMLQNDSLNTAYLDTLPELYAAVKNYSSCEYYTDIALLKNGNSEKYLQLKALCL